MENIVWKMDQVIAFASDAHEGQKRKYTGEDYIYHPIAVASLVREKSPMVIELQLAAILHDVLEDTKVTHEEMRIFLFKILSIEEAKTVFGLVVELTDVFTKEAFPGFNRKKRKELEAERLSLASLDARFIKALDMKDNLKSIMEHDPKFAKVFIKEKNYLMKKINF
jgi:(p)ppGpp synthase/HD superfamily hydrolase